jgi:hypothetical protein
MAQLKYWDGSAWVTAIVGAQGPIGPTGPAPNVGLTKIVPSSIAIGSGTGSVSASGTVTYSTTNGGSTISLNGVFSSTYTRYKILYDTAFPTQDDSFVFILRASGTDDYTNYWGQLVRGDSTDASASRYSSTVWNINNQRSYGNALTEVDLFNPFVASPTFGFSRNTAKRRGVNDLWLGMQGLNNTNSTSYDGFTLDAYFASTGTISVYGYN